MKRIWHNYKVWILIGMMYIVFYLIKNLKAIMRFSTRMSLPNESSLKSR